MIVKVCFNVNIGEALKLPLRIDSLNANKNCNFMQGLTGGTTVSSTMIAADATGIPVFVTGGIGGVHRGAQSSKFNYFIVNDICLT